MGFKPRYRRVCVHWDDASVDYGWKDPADAHRPDPRVCTVGYLVRRDQSAIEVAATVTPHAIAEVTRIPVGCAVRVERL